MKNKANDKLYNNEYSTNLEALSLYEEALRFEIKAFPDMASDDEKNDLATVNQLINEYRKAIRKAEKELIDQ